MNSQKGLASIIVVLILVAIVGVGILAWQYFGVPEEERKVPEELVEDETANWNTYRNETHKFEVKYPENWMTRKYSPGRQADLPEEERSVIISFASNQESLIEQKGVNIFVSPPTNFMSWESYIQCEEEIPIQNIKNLTQEGKIKQHCFTGENLYFFSLTDRIFNFYAGTEGKQIFNQMLSTFKFLETENETADWKTYRNEEYGFEIKYPEDIITLSQKDKGIVLIHSIPLEHPDPCDFKGDAPPLKKLIDFKVSIEVVNKNLRETIIANEGNYLVSNFLLDNKLKITPEFIDELSIGLLNGYRITSGAEGCGIYTYYFPLNSKKTLFIIRPWVAEFSPVSADYEKYLNLPGIIPLDKGEKIFNQMLSTFRFLE